MNRISHPLGAAACLSSLLQCVPAIAADSDIAALRAELDALKSQYESRIQVLEQRLNAAEQQLAIEQAQPAPATAPPAASPAYASSGNAFNPAMGVVMQGFARVYDRAPENYHIPGVPLGGEAGPGPEGLSIGESEFIFDANVDDWFYGRVTASVEQEDSEFNYSLEEAFLDTLSLPAGTGVRFGRFYSSIGYLNDKHSHTWEFADQALPYAAFLGNQYSDDGLQFHWLAPTELYIELGAEIFRGGSYPATGDAHDGFGTRTVFAHVGGDAGISSSWTAGLSWLNAEARDRDSGDEDDPLNFGGSTDLYIADFVWKWAPDGNVRERNFKFQAEYLWRNENGDYRVPGLPGAASIDADTQGWYAQAVYQWQPLWRVGFRLDGLNLDDPGRQFAGTPLADLGHNPLRYTAMVDYSHSEFSRLRLQFQYDDSGQADNSQVTLQYIMSIGAHGAHEF